MTKETHPWDSSALPPHLRSPEQQPDPFATPLGSEETSVFPGDIQSPRDLWAFLMNRWNAGVVPHMEELRWRIGASVGLWLLFTGASYWIAKPVLRCLQALAPKGTQFIQLAPMDSFMAIFQTMMTIGIVVSVPFWLWHLIRFLSPALTETEKQLIIPGLALGFCGSLAGLTFGYLVLLPSTLAILLDASSGIATPQMSIRSFIDFTLLMLGLMAMTFQLPLLAFVLGKLQIINRQHLQQHWRMIFVIMVILAAIITPSQDPITLAMVTFAMYLLYGVAYTLVPNSI